MAKLGRPSKTFIDSKIPLRCYIKTTSLLNFDIALQKQGRRKGEVVQELVDIYSDNVLSLAPSNPEVRCMFFDVGKCNAKNPEVRLGKTQALLCQNPQFHNICKRKLEGKRELMDKK